MYVFLTVGHFFSRHRKRKKLGWDVERAAGCELAAVLLALKTSLTMLALPTPPSPGGRPRRLLLFLSQKE